MLIHKRGTASGCDDQGNMHAFKQQPICLRINYCVALMHTVVLTAVCCNNNNTSRVPLIIYYLHNDGHQTVLGPAQLIQVCAHPRHCCLWLHGLLLVLLQLLLLLGLHSTAHMLCFGGCSST